jgi:hypothetical protein
MRITFTGKYHLTVLVKGYIKVTISHMVKVTDITSYTMFISYKCPTDIWKGVLF